MFIPLKMVLIGIDPYPYNNIHRAWQIGVGRWVKIRKHGGFWRSNCCLCQNWPGSCWTANGWNQWEAIGCKQGTAATRCGCACGAVEWCNSRNFVFFNDLLFTPLNKSLNGVSLPLMIRCFQCWTRKSVSKSSTRRLASAICILCGVHGCTLTSLVAPSKANTGAALHRIDRISEEFLWWFLARKDLPSCGCLLSELKHDHIISHHITSYHATVLSVLIPPSCGFTSWALHRFHSEVDDCAATMAGCRRLGNVKKKTAEFIEFHGVGAVTSMFIGIEWHWYVYQIVMFQHQIVKITIFIQCLSDLSDSDDSDADRKQDGTCKWCRAIYCARSWIFLGGRTKKNCHDCTLHRAIQAGKIATYQVNQVRHAERFQERSLRTNDHRCPFPIGWLINNRFLWW